MRIAIIGAGWIGCHLASKLKREHEVSLFDKDGIFSGSSMHNQNRLHLGFHYARNSQTRQLCKNTFEKFLLDYGSIVREVGRNVYAIPERESLLDFITYMSIFDQDSYSYNLTEVPELKDVEGSILVPEKRIDPTAAKAMFEICLRDVITIKEIKCGDIVDMRRFFDLVVNCTNNTLQPIMGDDFFEVALMLKYRKVKETSFDALTLVDGRFFSIFPSYCGCHTLSSVQHTPVATIAKPDQVHDTVKHLDVTARIGKFESAVLANYPNFLEDFAYDGFVTSVKSKFRSESSNRNPVVKIDGNLVSCYTGKIQGVYMVEDFVRRSLCEIRK